MTPVRRAVLTASRPRLQLGLLLLLAAAAGCPQSAPDKEAPAPSPPSTSTATAALPSDPAAREARIVEIATSHAVEKGHGRDSIKVASVKEANGRARVRFESEPRRPGSHFTIVVDVSNGKVADFIPGR
jgi:hypothetical protein